MREAVRGFNNAFHGCNRFNGKLTFRACKRGGLTLREAVRGFNNAFHGCNRF